MSEEQVLIDKKVLQDLLFLLHRPETRIGAKAVLIYSIEKALNRHASAARATEPVSEYKIDTFQLGPNGTWDVQRTSGVRVTHIPTGLFAESTEERSQHRNKEVAMEKIKNMLAGYNAACAILGNSDA